MVRTIGTGVVGIIDFVCLLVSYSFLRMARISVRWVTWLVGVLIGVASVACCAAVFSVAHMRTDITRSSLLGVLSFLIAVLAMAEWTTRRWYLLVKKMPLGALARASRAVLVYLRDHHMFFGWLVLLTAVAHAVILIPFWNRLNQYEIVTGIIALIVLAALTVFGQWIEVAVRRKQLAPAVRLLHTLLSFAFLMAFALHV